MDLSRVKTLKHNDAYRLVDVILRHGTQWKQSREIILSDPKYNDTILYEYLKNVGEEVPYRKGVLCPRAKLNEPNYELLKKIIWDHIKRKNYQIAGEDELVVHMRLGDVMVYRGGTRYASSIKRYANFYDKLDLDNLPITGVVVVTALHYGHATSKMDNSLYAKSRYRSFKLLRDFEKQTNDVGLPIRLVSQKCVDADICFLASSKYCVKSASLFMDIIKECLIDGKYFTGSIQ
jgi:hypothetical protein